MIRSICLLVALLVGLSMPGDASEIRRPGRYSLSPASNSQFCSAGKKSIAGVVPEDRISYRSIAKSRDLNGTAGLHSLQLFEWALLWLKNEDTLTTDRAGIDRYPMGGLTSLVSIHGVYFDPALGNTPAGAAAAHLPEVSDTEKTWSRCIHRDELFLLWHRAYVRAMELTVQQVLAKHGVANWESFRIPYWNWLEQGSLPDPFWKVSESPLFDDTRFPASNRGEEIWTIANGNPPKVGPNPFSRADTVTASQAFSVFSNEILLGWHNSVHAQVGGDMLLWASAARDPLFWVHHANVDRLFVAWLSGKDSNSQPRQIPKKDLKQAWEDAGFRFPIRTATGAVKWYAPTFEELGLDMSMVKGQAEYDNIDRPKVSSVPSLPAAPANAKGRVTTQDVDHFDQITLISLSNVTIGNAGTSFGLSQLSTMEIKRLQRLARQFLAAPDDYVIEVFARDIKLAENGLRRASMPIAPVRVFANLPAMEVQYPGRKRFYSSYLGTLDLFSLGQPFAAVQRFRVDPLIRDGLAKALRNHLRASQRNRLVVSVIPGSTLSPTDSIGPLMTIGQLALVARRADSTVLMSRSQ